MDALRRDAREPEYCHQIPHQRQQRRNDRLQGARSSVSITASWPGRNSPEAGRLGRHPLRGVYPSAHRRIRRLEPGSRIWPVFPVAPGGCSR